MARIPVVRNAAPGPKSAGQVLTWVAGDTVNHHSFVWTGKELLLAKNTHATTEYNVVIASVADGQGRQGIINTPIPAGETAVFGPFVDPRGWVQDNGRINLQAGNAAVQLAIVVLP